MPKRYGQPCPVARTLELVGERWTLLVVRDLPGGPRRFHDLLTSLRGVAPTVLSARLKIMETHGLIDRRLYSDHPPRVEYALTERGRELGWIIGALAQWGSRHAQRGRALVHEGCGHRVRLGYYCCEKCRQRVRGAAVRLARPRQGAGARRARRSATVTRS